MTLKNEPRIIRESLSKPEAGSFAVQPEDNESLEWIHCRDTFSSSFTKETEGFYFSHNVDRKRIASFVEKTEIILEQRMAPAAQLRLFADGPTAHFHASLFQPTNRDHATWVEPCGFWKQIYIRRSLFTLLLRAGQRYDPTADNYEEALYSIDYLKSSKDAVMRFLFGFTDFHVDQWSCGWAATFCHKDIEEIRTKLISKDNTEVSLIGVGSIWR
jgi:hypothetical protein